MPTETQIMEAIGYLLIGHGTRRSSGQMQFRRLFEQFRREISPAMTEMAFLELAEPTIEQSVARLKERGAKRLIPVPVLLFSAGHAEQDIPRAVQRAASQHRLEVGSQTPALESAEAVVALSAAKFRKAVCETDERRIPCERLICCGQCKVDCCGKAALTMIGRGSSSVEATRRMRAFTGARMRYTPVSWAQTAFIHAQSPDVSAAMDTLQESPYRLKVVQPHLLFEGVLAEQLREVVADRQKSDPENHWVITEVLGAEGDLATTLVGLAQQAASERQGAACV